MSSLSSIQHLQTTLFASARFITSITLSLPPQPSNKSLLHRSATTMRADNVLIFAAVAMASPAPAPQAVNFAAVAAAPAVASGPSYGVSVQTGVYQQSSALSAASAAATTTASAAQKKRDLIFGWGAASTTPCSTTTTAAAAKTTTTTAKAVSITTSSSSSSSSSATTSATTTSIYSDANACKPTATGYAPVPTPDTADGFYAYAPYHAMASSALTPSGYTLSFRDLNASVSQSSYLGVNTLTSYNTTACASLCDSTSPCTAFNVYIERDPAVDPGKNCTNPPSAPSYFCTLWGSSVNSSTATNYGQYRESFHVEITASNGYDKTPAVVAPSCSGWQAPQKCGPAADGSLAHSHPSTAMGSHFFPGPYDPTQCAAYAQAQNLENAGGSSLLLWALSLITSPLNCKFFNAYMLKQDGAAMGTMCVLFDTQYPTSQATYTPGWANGHYYSVESSWSYCSQ